MISNKEFSKSVVFNFDLKIMVSCACDLNVYDKTHKLENLKKARINK